MPLQVAYTNPSTNTLFPNAYFVAHHPVYEAGKYLDFRVQVFSSKANFDAGFKCESCLHYRLSSQPDVFPLPDTSADFASFFAENILSQDGKTLLSQIYEYLKTLPLFAGATEL